MPLFKYTIGINKLVECPLSSAMSKRDRWAGIKGELMGWLALGAIAVVLHLITMAI